MYPWVAVNGASRLDAPDLCILIWADHVTEQGLKSIYSWRKHRLQIHIMINDSQKTPGSGPNDPKLSERGGLAQPVPSGGSQEELSNSNKAPDAEAQAVTDRSGSLLRHVRPVGVPRPAYYVAHPDGSFSIADPQPTLSSISCSQETREAASVSPLVPARADGDSEEAEHAHPQ